MECTAGGYSISPTTKLSLKYDSPTLKESHTLYIAISPAHNICTSEDYDYVR